MSSEYSVHLKLVESGGLQIIGRENKVLMTFGQKEVRNNCFETLTWAKYMPPTSSTKYDSSIWLLSQRDNQNCNSYQFDLLLKYGNKNPKLCYMRTNQTGPYVASTRDSDGYNQDDKSAWRIQYRNSDQGAEWKMNDEWHDAITNQIII